MGRSHCTPDVEFAAFLRGVNVGRRTLRTAEWAATFSDFRVANVGAAGTFAISGAPSEARLRRELLAAAPFPTEAVLLARSDLQALLRAPAFGGPSSHGGRRSVTFLAATPRAVPALPMTRPTGGPWEVRLFEFRSPAVFGEHRRFRPDRILYPNEVVEREFGVPATTRWWETVEQVEAAFASAPEPTRRPARRPGRTGSPAPAPRGPARSGRRTGSRTG